MAKINLLNIEGNIVKDVQISKNVFVEEPHKQSIFDCIIAENAALRQGTHSTLTKGEVRGGGRKPWRQKHTGRARTGSTRNPHWVGGGVVFGPKPGRNYNKKVNSKIFKLAFKSALTLKLNSDSLFALSNDAKFEKPSTKKVITLLSNAKLEDKKVLFVVDKIDENFLKSTANLQKAKLKMLNQVSVKDIVEASIIIFNEASIKNLETEASK